MGGALCPLWEGQKEGEQVIQHNAGKAGPKNLPSQKALWQLKALAGAGQFPAQHLAAFLSARFPLRQMVFPPLRDKTVGNLPLWKAAREKGSIHLLWLPCLLALEGVEL